MLELNIADGNYVFMHENRCNGNIVAVLPYRIVDNKIDVLVRYENNPAWTNKRDEFLLTMITGGVENDISETVMTELREEGGYVIDEIERFEQIGSFRNSKA